MVLHGLWDFGIFTGLVDGRDNLYLGTTLFIIADVIMLIIALATIRKVFPRREEHAA
jgi:biotin transporter BioY